MKPMKKMHSQSKTGKQPGPKEAPMERAIGRMELEPPWGTDDQSRILKSRRSFTAAYKLRILQEVEN